MRTAEIDRNTFETQISVSINLDGSGQRNFQTRLPFLDHMLDQVARHGLSQAVAAPGALPADVLEEAAPALRVVPPAGALGRIGSLESILRGGRALLRDARSEPMSYL